MLSSSAVPAAKFTEVYRELLQVDPAKRKRNLDVAFDVRLILIRILLPTTTYSYYQL